MKYRNTKKPPIGIMPEWLHNEQRRETIADGMIRYLEADVAIPDEWIDEYNRLIEQKPTRT